MVKIALGISSPSKKSKDKKGGKKDEDDEASGEKKLTVVNFFVCGLLFFIVPKDKKEVDAGKEGAEGGSKIKAAKKEQ